MSGTWRNGRPMLTPEMVLGAMQGFADSGRRCVTTSEIQRAVQLAYPDVVIHKGAVNTRLRQLRAQDKVNDIVAARKGVDTLWELIP